MSGLVDEQISSIHDGLAAKLIQAIAPHSTERATCSHWYQAWINGQLPAIRPWLADCLSDFSEEEADNWQTPFMRLWQEMGKILRNNNSDVTIVSIVSELIRQGVLKSNSIPNIQKQIVFAVLGWQTMLWKVDTGNSPATLLCISDELHGYPGQAGLVRRQDLKACQRPLPQFSMGFGALLPSPRYFAHDIDEEDQLALKSITRISTETLNVHLLASMNTRFTVKWTDVLSHHLEFDQRRQQLYLFRYPSFCLANIDTENDKKDGAIYACGQDDGKPGSQYWATRSNIQGLLQETLCSYRLLFGQSKAARRQYRSLRPFPDSSLEDPLLHDLCGRKRCDLMARYERETYERETYELDTDFMMYKNRLVLLYNALAKEKPRTWKQLWNDKRDSAQWLTFWLVLVFGGTGILLQFIQVILQVVTTVSGNG